MSSCLTVLDDVPAAAATYENALACWPTPSFHPCPQFTLILNFISL